MVGKIKLGARYVVLGFIMYLAYVVTSADYLNSTHTIDPMTLNVIVGSIFGALTLVIKAHFETKVSEDGGSNNG